MEKRERKEKSKSINHQRQQQQKKGDIHKTSNYSYNDKFNGTELPLPLG